MQERDKNGPGKAGLIDRNNAPYSFLKEPEGSINVKWLYYFIQQNWLVNQTLQVDGLEITAPKSDVKCGKHQGLLHLQFHPYIDTLDYFGYQMRLNFLRPVFSISFFL